MYFLNVCLKVEVGFFKGMKQGGFWLFYRVGGRGNMIKRDGLIMNIDD